MKHLVRDNYAEGGYVFASSARRAAQEAGFENPANLASNENPFAPSESVITAGLDALHSANRYPDETYALLKQTLKDVHGDFTFVTGTGMDGVIETCLRVLLSAGDTVVISTPTFSFYKLAVEAQGGNVITVQREQDFSVDLKHFISAAKDAKISFLCSPNNPTGTLTLPDDVATILGSINGVLFLDNAYVEFAKTDYTALLEEFDNLIIGRTMSKCYGLAGLRVGYAFVPKWFEPYYTRAQTPFAINQVSEASAIASLQDTASATKYCEHVTLWRRRFAEDLPFPTLPSGANYVLVDVNLKSGDEVTMALAQQGVIVRSCSGFPGLEDHYIRVCVGTDDENQQFLKAMKTL